MARQFFTVLIAVAAVLLISEFGVRILSNLNRNIRLLAHNPYEAVDFDRIVDWKTLHAAIDYSFLPGDNFKGFNVNSHGFLFPELPYRKRGDEYRIVLLGDSFAVGVVPYKYHFIQLFERKLQATTQLLSRRYQTINLGIPGVGTGIYRKAYEVEGSKYDPDAVIVSFYVGNDFTDEAESRAKLVNNLEPLRKDGIVRMLYASRLFALAYNTYALRKFLPPQNKELSIAVKSDTKVLGDFADTNEEYDPLTPTYGKDTYYGIVRDSLKIVNEQTFPDWRMAQENILAIHRETGARGVKLVVLIIPTEWQVYPELYRAVAPAADPAAVNMEMPQQVLRSFLDANGIEYIDVLPAFTDASGSSVLYQPNDSHINTYGNRLVSEELFRYFSSLPGVLAPGNIR